MDVKTFSQILTYWKIVYIFKIIERNHMWIQTTKLKNIVLEYHISLNFSRTKLNMNEQYIYILHYFKSSFK